MLFSSLELQKEVAWREKYQIDFAANLPEEHVSVKAAPLLTFNVWRKSDLGKILIGHSNTRENKLFIINRPISFRMNHVKMTAWREQKNEAKSAKKLSKL